MKSIQPLFSIVIANYNYGRFLEDAIQSVIAQDMNDQVELIICDAASTDNSIDIIKKYAGGLPPNISRSEWTDSNAKLQTSNSNLITWWCSEKDGGQSAAFNKGFSHACGKFLTWLNADDILLTGALKAICALHKKMPDAEWLTGSSVRTDENLNVIDCAQAHKFSYLRARFADLMVGSPSSFFTKRLFEQVGGLNESLHYCMDLDLWRRFYDANQIYHRTLDYIFAVRIHGESKTGGHRVSSSEKNMVDMNNASMEASWFRNKYKINPRLNFAVNLLSFSLIDKIFGIYHLYKYKGKSAIEI